MLKKKKNLIIKKKGWHMLGYGKENELHIRFHIAYHKIIWMNVLCFLMLCLYCVMAFFIGKFFFVHIT